jgi:hypothetical protein
LPKPRSHAKPTRSPAPSGPPAIFDASSLGSPILLDKDWRVGVTSNTAAATTDFDDSAWAIRDAKAVISEVPNEDETNTNPGSRQSGGSSGTPARKGSQQRYAWFRIHIKLAPNHGPIALLIELPVSTSTSFSLTSTEPTPDVFANGTQIKPEGPHGNAPEQYQQISRIYDLNVPPSETSLTLVARTIDIPFGYNAYTSFFSGRSLLLGNHDDLGRELNLWTDRNLYERMPRLVYAVLLALLGIFLFALYFAQKGHVEYLWLALHELVQAPIIFIELAGHDARLDTLWYAALMLQLALASAYLFFEFLVAFLALPRRWYIKWLRYTAPVLAGVGPLLLMFGHSRAFGIPMAVIFGCSFLWIIGWSIFIFGTLIAAALRRNFEAGLFLIPLVFSVLGIVEPVMASVVSEGTGAVYSSPFTIHAGPIPIHIGSFGDFAGILVIVLIIFFRFLRVQRDQEHATSELAAARSVQELLIPRKKLATPGFEVESVYTPASEVGGDFFHVQMVEDGMLVVIGDVAGKGLKAAMNVSLLMGALRRTEEQSPARILESLNRVLAGTESFTTCQVIWFAASGEMVVANAGHLPPYLNSQEIALPSGLPLGVLPEVSQYEEARFYLHPGDRVLLLSDGVVEARQPSGELFGFDRLRQLCNQSAAYLAEAAKAFGQQDDITVLTVRRQAQILAT